MQRVILAEAGQGALDRFGPGRQSSGLMGPKRTAAQVRPEARVTLVMNRTGGPAYALNVLAGAVETAPELSAVKVVFADNEREAVVPARQAARGGQQVVVAWSFYSPAFARRVAELARLKAALKDLEIWHLVGGVHATAEPAQTLRAGFDLVAVGEGEQIVRELLGRLLAGQSPGGTRGIAHLEGDQVVTHGAGERIDVDAFPPFAPGHGKFNPIQITRGCIYGCKFCQTPFMFKARFRHRSVENVCHFVRLMKERGLVDVRFITPTALSYGSDDEQVRLDKIEELLLGVRRALGTCGRIFFGTFPSEVRPEHVSLEALRLLKRYVANNNLIIGGQSGSEDILRSTRRGHSAEAITAAVRWAREAGFLPNVDLIFGLPGETSADVQATLRLAERLAGWGARIHAHTFMPLPGTPYRHAPPGQPDPAALRAIGRLSARGRLYGQWRQQAAVAQELAARQQPQGRSSPMATCEKETPHP